MLAYKPYNNFSQYLDHVRGTEVARGSAGSTSNASPTMTSSAAFADVAIGDTMCISGESATFTVSGKGSSSSITLSGNATATRTGTAVWRAFRGGIGHAAVLENVASPTVHGAGFIIYDDTSFTN